MKDNVINRGLLKKILVVVLVLILAGIIYGLVFGGMFYRPFEDFQGPSYIPTGFNETNNMTTENERICEYSGNGTFWACVIKNTTNPELKELIDPFQDDPTDIKKSTLNLTVNDHVVCLKISEKNFKTDANTISDLLEKVSPHQNITQAKLTNINIDMAKFQAMWYCEETDLTYIITGLVTHDQLPEIEKMTKSMKCHTQETWITKIKKWIQRRNIPEKNIQEYTFIN